MTPHDFSLEQLIEICEVNIDEYRTKWYQSVSNSNLYKIRSQFNTADGSILLENFLVALDECTISNLRTNEFVTVQFKNCDECDQYGSLDINISFSKVKYEHDFQVKHRLIRDFPNKIQEYIAAETIRLKQIALAESGVTAEVATAELITINADLEKLLLRKAELERLV